LRRPGRYSTGLGSIRSGSRSCDLGGTLGSEVCCPTMPPLALVSPQHRVGVGASRCPTVRSSVALDRAIRSRRPATPLGSAVRHRTRARQDQDESWWPLSSSGEVRPCRRAHRRAAGVCPRSSTGWFSSSRSTPVVALGEIAQRVAAKSRRLRTTSTLAVPPSAITRPGSPLVGVLAARALRGTRSSRRR